MMSESNGCIDGEVFAGTVSGNQIPPIVLLHSLGLDRTFWEPLVPRLRELSDVVLVDLPGHGNSCHTTETSIEEMADELDRFLEEHGIDSVIAVGLSLGGCVAQALALHHPDRVRALALCDTTSWYGPEGPKNWAERSQQAREMGLGSLAGFQLERWFSEEFRAANAELCEELLDVFRANDLPSYEATCGAMGEFNASGNLSKIGVPTTVIVGESDFATPLSHAEVIAAGIPGARLRVIEDALHLTPLEKPDAFVEEVERLVAAL
jgi:3-oxoadipate enol-lactonase